MATATAVPATCLKGQETARRRCYTTSLQGHQQRMMGIGSKLKAKLFEHGGDRRQVCLRLGLVLDLLRTLFLDVVCLRLDLALGLKEEQEGKWRANL